MKSLDLHGIKHSDAENLIDDFLGRHYNTLPIEIITGNSFEMQSILKNKIKQFKLKMEPSNYINLGSYIISYNNY